MEKVEAKVEWKKKDDDLRIAWRLGATKQETDYADIPGIGRVFRETTVENGKETTLFYMNGDRRTWIYLHHLIATKNVEK